MEARGVMAAGVLALLVGLFGLTAPVVAQAPQGVGAEQGASAEAGEQGEGHETIRDIVTTRTFIWQCINVAALFAILFWMFRKPVGEFLQSRRATIEEGLAEAQRLTAAADAKYREYATRLEQLDQEMEKLRTEMIRAGEAERDRIVRGAEEKAARLRRDADLQVEQQMKQLREDLTHEAVEAAITTAQALLQKQTTLSDQSRLAEEYVKRLGRAAEEEEAA